jgi:hypothetical protein
VERFDTVLKNEPEVARDGEVDAEMLRGKQSSEYRSAVRSYNKWINQEQSLIDEVYRAERELEVAVARVERIKATPRNKRGVTYVDLLNSARTVVKRRRQTVTDTKRALTRHQKSEPERPKKPRDIDPLPLLRRPTKPSQSTTQTPQQQQAMRPMVQATPEREAPRRSERTVAFDQTDPYGFNVQVVSDLDGVWDVIIRNRRRKVIARQRLEEMMVAQTRERAETTAAQLVSDPAMMDNFIGRYAIED